jgi:phage/plasmid-associated DNA primase
MGGALKHKNPITYKQQTKYWICTNNLNFDYFDESVSKKLIIFNFKNQVFEKGTAEAKKTGKIQDTSLKNKLLTQKNSEFIIKWIIDGYKMFLEEGLELTNSNRDEIEMIERDTDPIGVFVKKSLIKTDNYEDISCDLKTLYKSYCYFEEKTNLSNQFEVVRYRKFCKIIRNRGFEIISKHISKSEHLLYIRGYIVDEANFNYLPDNSWTYSSPPPTSYVPYNE